MEGMIKFKGNNYTIDIESIVEYTKLTKKIEFEDVITRLNEESSDVEVETTEKFGDDYDNGKSDVGGVEPDLLDVTKWDIVRGLLETVLNTDIIIDNKMPLERQVPFNFMLSLNTLISNKFIIKK